METGGVARAAGKSRRKRGKQPPLGPYEPYQERGGYAPQSRKAPAKSDAKRRQGHKMAEVAKLLVRQFCHGWRGMTPSGLIHKLLRFAQQQGARLGIKSMLRYLCGFRRDRASWTSGEWAFARSLRWVCGRLSSWRATRPVVGGIRAASALACSYACRRNPKDSVWVLPRRLVASCRDTIPNAHMPVNIRIKGEGIPALARRLYSRKGEIHPSNYDALRQGLTPQDYRSYQVYKDPDPSIGVVVAITRRDTYKVYRLMSLYKADAQPIIEKVGTFKPRVMFPDTEEKLKKFLFKWAKPTDNKSKDVKSKLRVGVRRR